MLATQMTAFEQAVALDDFENRMVVHLRDFAPRHSKVIGDDWVRRVIRLGVERARVYGVVNPGLLRFHVELMFMFGGAFDTDPLIPWAGRVLGDPRIDDEVPRMERLHEEMLGYLEAVGGPDRSFAIQAMRNIKQFLGEEPPYAELREERRALDALAQIYPKRCAYLGEAPLRDLLRRGAEEAARLGIATERGVVLVTGLMFGLGHGFADDPLFPWILVTLRDPAITDADRRVERLSRRVEIYLDRALQYLERRRADVQQ